jgi:hypothetical protein
MKYVEEISFGDAFEFQGNVFVLTQDFNKNNQHKCILLNSGESRWIFSNEIVNPIEIYTLDHENNIVPIKKRKLETN